MQVARWNKKSPHSWSDLKKIFPTLVEKNVYENVRYGYCDGVQAEQHVRYIRYYYYILYGLSKQDSPEAKILKPLLKNRPSNWPS